MMRLVLCVALGVLTLPMRAAAGDFSNWAAIVVAGDNRAHSGAQSDVFDNARRDIAATLQSMGFASSNILQFSTQPGRFPFDGARPSTAHDVSTALWDLSNSADAGCFAYFTSHGSQDGIVLGEGTLSPQQMSNIIGNACGGKPTVVIVSACYSGVFVPALAAPERIVFTAASSNRTSFGCGESDRYTFFDTCALQWLKRSGDFPDFGKEVVACVAAREKKEQVGLPSEPQFVLGADAGAIPKWH